MLNKREHQQEQQALLDHGISLQVKTRLCFSFCCLPTPKGQFRLKIRISAGKRAQFLCRPSSLKDSRASHIWALTDLQRRGVMYEQKYPRKSGERSTPRINAPKWTIKPLWRPLIFTASIDSVKIKQKPLLNRSNHKDLFLLFNNSSLADFKSQKAYHTSKLIAGPLLIEICKQRTWTKIRLILPQAVFIAV